MAWAMPANWRADCHAARAAACRRGTAGSSQRDSEAAVRKPTPYCVTLYSALKRLTSEECQREENKGVERSLRTALSRAERTHNMCWLPHREAKPTPSLAANTWSEKRSVGWSPMPSAEWSKVFCARVCWSVAPVCEPAAASNGIRRTHHNWPVCESATYVPLKGRVACA